MIKFKKLCGISVPKYNTDFEGCIHGYTTLDVVYYKKYGIKIISKREGYMLIEFQDGYKSKVRLWFKNDLIESAKVYLFEGEEYV